MIYASFDCWFCVDARAQREREWSAAHNLLSRVRGYWFTDDGDLDAEVILGAGLSVWGNWRCVGRGRELDDYFLRRVICVRFCGDLEIVGYGCRVWVWRFFVKVFQKNI